MKCLRHHVRLDFAPAAAHSERNFVGLASHDRRIHAVAIVLGVILGGEEKVDGSIDTRDIAVKTDPDRKDEFSHAPKDTRAAPACHPTANGADRSLAPLLCGDWVYATRLRSRFTASRHSPYTACMEASYACSFRSRCWGGFDKPKYGKTNSSAASHRPTPNSTPVPKGASSRAPAIAPYTPPISVPKP